MTVRRPGGENPHIMGVEMIPVRLPFREDFKSAVAGGLLGAPVPRDELDFGRDYVILRLVAEDHGVGVGEALASLPETGATPGQIIETIQTGLCRSLIGADPFNARAILENMDRHAAGNHVSKGLVDQALHDLMGRISNRPAREYMSDKSAEKIPLCAAVHRSEPAEMTARAKQLYSEGYRGLRLCLGHGAETDREIVRAVREELGPDVLLQVSYASALDPVLTVEAIEAIEPFNLVLAELPAKFGDYAEMVRLRKKLAIPLMATPGALSMAEMEALMELGAAEAVGITGESPGGVIKALQALDLAERKGFARALRNRTLGIGAAVLVHIAAGRPNPDLSVELWSNSVMEDDLAAEPVKIDNGAAAAPKGPGWGVELDYDALDKYATRDAVTVEID